VKKELLLSPSSSDSSDRQRVPQKLPVILDGRFYTNVQPNAKTVGGIQATCTSCFGIISGTPKSTGNFLSHIKRRHKDILTACQLHCQGKTVPTGSHISSIISRASSESTKKKALEPSEAMQPVHPTKIFQSSKIAFARLDTSYD